MIFIEYLREGGGVTTQHPGVKVVDAATREDDDDIAIGELRELRFLGGHFAVRAMMC